MLEPSDDLFTRVLAIPDEAQAEADPGLEPVGRRRARRHAARGRDVDVRPRRAVGRVRGRGRRRAPVAARRPGATAPAPHDAAPAARRARRLPAQHRGLARRGGGLRGGGADPRRHGRHRRRRQHGDAGRGRDRHADGHRRPPPGSLRPARAWRWRTRPASPPDRSSPARRRTRARQVHIVIDGLPTHAEAASTPSGSRRTRRAASRSARSARTPTASSTSPSPCRSCRRRTRTSGSRASRRRARRAGRQDWVVKGPIAGQQS